MKEYPQEYDRNDPLKDIPYYPIPKDENTALYEKYADLVKSYRNITLVGRLAEYKYYDMNNIITRSLELFDEKFLAGGR
jgi:UDP-galactopyranose mutase